MARLRAQGGSRAQDLPTLFGERDLKPAVEAPPAPVHALNQAQPAELVRPLGFQYGWVDKPYLTGPGPGGRGLGMSTLYVDQVQHQPDREVRTNTRSVIRQSAQQPNFHIRNAWWLFSQWQPVHMSPMTEAGRANQPGGVFSFQVGDAAGPNTVLPPSQYPASGAQMAPPITRFMQAWRVPRFSSEPATIIPVGINYTPGGS